MKHTKQPKPSGQECKYCNGMGKYEIAGCVYTCSCKQPPPPQDKQECKCASCISMRKWVKENECEYCQHEKDMGVDTVLGQTIPRYHKHNPPPAINTNYHYEKQFITECTYTDKDGLRWMKPSYRDCLSFIRSLLHQGEKEAYEKGQASIFKILDGDEDFHIPPLKEYTATLEIKEVSPKGERK